MKLYITVENQPFLHISWLLTMDCSIMYMLNVNWSPMHVIWHSNKSCSMYVLWMLKLHSRCCQSSLWTWLKLRKRLQKVHCTCLHHNLQIFFHFSLWSALFEVPQEVPLPRTIITLACDPHWVAGREMNSQVGLQGLEDYFVWTNTACSSSHSFTMSDWCWQFPQTKLCHSKTWSMALIFQILTSIRPRSNLFLPTTKNIWCCFSSWKPCFKKIPVLLHPF